jgi:hypothetical protein
MTENRPESDVTGWRSLPPVFSRFEGDFDAWVKHVFDHPAPASGASWADRPWYFDSKADCRVPDDATCVRFCTRLFRDPIPPLARFDDAQIAQGLQFLNGLGQHHAWTLVHGETPFEERLAGLAAMSGLFRRLFAVRCTPTLSHHDESPASPLNGICYMWWDVFPTIGHPSDPLHAEIDATILRIMRESLEIDHAAILESALHGLGHWQHSYPDLVRSTIDAFLDCRRRQKVLRHELVIYAESAREGEVL